MIVDKDNPKMGTMIKLGATDDAEFPESSAGNTPHYGQFTEKPIVGQSFWLMTERGIFRTSFIVKIVEETENRMVFHTNNSVYQLTINLFEDID